MSNTPPGHLADRKTGQCNAQGRIMVPIRSRGAGTYILAVNRPLSAPLIQSVAPNGQEVGRRYDFSTTGRPRTNWLVWHLDGNAAGSFKVAFSVAPYQTVVCELWLAPQGTPRPSGSQWQPSDWMRH